MNSLYRIFIVSLCMIAFLALVFLLMRMLFAFFTTARTTGFITGIVIAYPKSRHFVNSKRARVSYSVGERTYVSDKFITVPMDKEIGQTVTVRYCIKTPERLFYINYKTIIACFFLFAIFLGLALAPN